MSLLRWTTHTLTPRARVSFIRTSSLCCPSRIETRLSPACIRGRRNIHVGAAVGDLVRSTAEGLSTVHSAGLPWYITIPLLAVGVNFALRLPIQYYARKVRVRRSELNPLVSAWMARHALNIGRTQPELPERIKALRIASSTEKSRRRIYKAWGTQRWKSLAPLLGMFPFVIISEALRRKCGAPLGWISHKVGLGNVEGLNSASAMFDQSLSSGGLLWFTDLTSMDPCYVLPILCSAILAGNAWGKMSKDQLVALLSLDNSQTITKFAMTRVQKVLGRTLLCVPIFPLLFADLPSAIFLYWSSSFALTNLNDFILDRLVPLKPQTLKAEVKIPKVRLYVVGQQSA